MEKTKLEFFRSLIEKTENFDHIKTIFVNTSKTMIDLDKDQPLNSDEQETVRNLSLALKGKETKIVLEKNPNEGLKFLRNKTVNSKQKAKLGLLLQYEITSPEILLKNFRLNEGKIIGYIYRIVLVKKFTTRKKSKENSEVDINGSPEEELHKEEKTVDESKCFAIFFAGPLLNSIPIKLLNCKSTSQVDYTVELFRIVYTRKVKVSKCMFDKMVIFHHHLFADLSNPKEFDSPDSFRFLDSNSQERKYLICPLKRISDVKWKINEKKLTKVNDSHHNVKAGKSIQTIIDELKKGKSKIKNKNEQIAQINEKVKKKIFYSYKHLLYEVNYLFFSKESSCTLLEKVIQAHNDKHGDHILNADNSVPILMSKYFPNISAQEFTKLSSGDLILNSQTVSESINFFRRMSETNKISVNYNAEAFALGNGIKLMPFCDFTYNRHHSQSSDKSKSSKLKSDISVGSIFPIEHLTTFFLNKKDYKMALKLPTLLAEFERVLLSMDFCAKYSPSCLSSTSVSDYAHLQKILHTTTAPSLLRDYDFESMETLGDSVIKFILTLCIFDNFPKWTEGAMQSHRRDLLKNDKLQNVAIESEVYKFIAATNVRASKWEPPMKRSFSPKYEQSITKKGAADSLEAIIGGLFMINKKFELTLHFIRQVKILPDNLKFSKSLENKLVLTTCESKWSNQTCHIQDDITFLDAFYSSKADNRFSVSMPFSNRIVNEQGKVNINSLRCLESRIHYKFKNPLIVKSAMTHQSSSKDNYQQLELLGDSVLEIYILVRLFQLFEDKLFSKDEKLEEKGISEIFNCGNLTHAKSLLCSNYFLMRLTILLNLQEFLVINDKQNMEGIEVFFDDSSIRTMLNQKLNEYNPKLAGSKILSDIFESLLGAILLDSNLEAVFSFLDDVFSPFLYYTAENLSHIKYSPISEFIELCHSKYNIGPKFSKS